MIMLTTEKLQSLLTHGVEDISGAVCYCNRKFASQVATWEATIRIFCSRNRVIMVRKWKA